MSMRLESVPLTPANVERSVPLWPDRTTYAPHHLEHAVHVLKFLLRERRVFGALVLVDNEARAYGLSTFVEEAAVDEELRTPQPLIGKRLLLSVRAPGYAPICDDAGIGAGNTN